VDYTKPPHESGYNLVWAFQNQDRNFVLGVEAGVTYERLLGDERQTFKISVHADNEGELTAMAAQLGRRVAFKYIDETWREATFTKVPIAPGGAHDTDSTDCWCKPRFFKPCRECENGDGCWKCGGTDKAEFRGLIEITHDEADADDDGIVTVHNE
jgi:hypothetical protein